MKQLIEFIAEFELALTAKDWPRIAALNQSLQSIVSQARKSVGDSSAESKQFEQVLKQLDRLCSEASDYATLARDAAAKELKTLADGKAGTAEYAAQYTNTD